MLSINFAALGPVFAARADLAERLIASLKSAIQGQKVQLDGPEPNKAACLRLSLVWAKFSVARSHLRQRKPLPMRMIRFVSIFLAATLVCAIWQARSAEPGRATADEVVARVREAVALLSKEGERGLAALRKRKSHFVWKDSYVFVSDCEKGIILANPYQPEREGKPIAAGATYAGVTAAERAAAQCATADRPNGGWSAYHFPEPGTQKIIRKVSYLLMVSGTKWLVGAGVYDATTPIGDLEKATEAGR